MCIRKAFPILNLQHFNAPNIALLRKVKSLNWKELLLDIARSFSLIFLIKILFFRWNIFLSCLNFWIEFSLKKLYFKSSKVCQSYKNVITINLKSSIISIKFPSKAILIKFPSNFSFINLLSGNLGRVSFLLIKSSQKFLPAPDLHLVHTNHPRRDII